MEKNFSIGAVESCQICHNKRLKEVLSLGHQPIVQDYLTKEDLQQPEATYPLALIFCERCKLLQLNYIVEPRKVFHLEYPYRTGLTNMLVRNFRSLAEELHREYTWQKGDLIVDIGSNDGTLLHGFKEKGMRVLGVEPTNAAKVANHNSIPTLQEFFNEKTVQTIIRRYGKAKIITATNVFAHINNAPALAKNVANLLDKEGVFISESQYLMDIIEKLEFDTIYHEHLRFYALKPLAYMFRMHGLSLVDAERISAAGGSIRVFAKKGTHPMSSRTKKLIAAEEKAGIYKMKTLIEFRNKVYAAKNDLLTTLLQCKKKGAKIVGLTSSARSNTLLGFSHIDTTLLTYSGEKKGSPKIGLYTPGTHIPVFNESQIIKEQPDYVLVLSWHIGKELIEITKRAGYKGKFIIPLPKVKIVS